MTTPPWSGPAVATESRTGAILAGNIVPQTLASFFVVARIISKAWIRRSWGPDDTMLIVAWITSIALTILSCLATSYGAGIHVEELPVWALKTNLKLQYATLICYNLALSFTKISICLFYLSIFADTLNRRLAKAALVFIVLYTVPLEAVSIFQCTPLKGMWDKSISAKCINTIPHFYVSVVCNMIADVWLLVQVVPNILPLPLPRRQKIILLFVVSLGWVVIVASILRVVRISPVISKWDFTWYSYDVTIWSAIEVDVGLICVATPATKPLFKKFAPKFLRSVTDDTEQHTAVVHPLGSIVRRPAMLPLHEPRNIGQTRTIQSFSRIWDVGGLLSPSIGDCEVPAGERTSLATETSDLERSTKPSRGSGSNRSSWSSMRKI